MRRIKGKFWGHHGEFYKNVQDLAKIYIGLLPKVVQNPKLHQFFALGVEQEELRLEAEALRY